MNDNKYIENTVINQGIFFENVQNKIIQNALQKEKSWFSTEKINCSPSSSSPPQQQVNNNNNTNNRNNSIVEGFEGGYISTNDSNTPIADKSAQNYDDSTIENQEIDELNNLKTQYNQTIKQYNSYLEESTDSAKNYITRISKNNPYLNKNISLVNGQTMYVTNHGIAKWYPNDDIFKSTTGKNGCPSPAGIVHVNGNQYNYNKPGLNLHTDPPLKVGSYMENGQSCGNEGGNVFVDSVLQSNIEAKYIGCYVADDSGASAMKLIEQSTPIYNYESCQSAAISSGNRFFALQNVNVETGFGYCAVSNDLKKSTKYGIAYTTEKITPLWSSNIVIENVFQPLAFLSNMGSLCIIRQNSLGIPLSFQTPVNTSIQSNYIGCYADNTTRAMTEIGNGGYTYETCMAAASKTSGTGYFGLQFVQPNGTGQCFSSTSIEKTTQYGPATNCTTVAGAKYGGGWSNAVYGFSPGAPHYLILQDDGNMAIYLGSGPNDKQELIWQTGTSGKQQNPNPKYAAINGKFKQNWMSIQQQLNIGDFIGSTDGSIYLIMQQDGNLVLNTSTRVENCKKIKNNGNTNTITNTITKTINEKIGGGINANAIYDIGETGYPTNLGNVGYVDGIGILSQYPNSMIGLDSTYSKAVPGIQYPMTPIGGPSFELNKSFFENTNEIECKEKCNNNIDCKSIGVVDVDFFGKPLNICLLSKSPLNNKTQIVASEDYPNLKTFFRNPKVKNPKSCPKGINNINSVEWNNYIKSKEMMTPSKNCLKNDLTITDDPELKKLENKLYNISSQINQQTQKLMSKRLTVEQQSKMNNISIHNMVNSYASVNEQIDRESNKEGFSNIDGIVKDSHIRVLHESYEYLLWGILTITTLALLVKIAKK